MPGQAVYDHIDKARQHLHAAAEGSDCPVCTSMLREQAQDVDMTFDLMRKVERIADRGPQLADANKRADEMLGGERGEQRDDDRDDREDDDQAEPRSGIIGRLGILPEGGFGLRGMLQNRPRLMDMNPFRGRRRGGR